MKEPVYKKATDLKWKVEEGQTQKISLSIKEEGEDPFRETPWCVVHPDSSGVRVLVNHALIMTPYQSWGMVFRAGMSTDLTKWYQAEKVEIELHPEAWDFYIQNQIIDENGKFIPEENRTKKEQENG